MKRFNISFSFSSLCLVVNLQSSVVCYFSVVWRLDALSLLTPVCSEMKH